MTMARIDENNEVIQVGLPKRLKGTDIEDLRRRGLLAAHQSVLPDTLLAIR